MHTGEWAVKLYVKKIFGYVMDSKMLFGHLSKHLCGCLIATGILFCLSVVISGAVDQGDEVTWDYRLGANKITGSVAMQRDSGRELCTVCPCYPPGAPLKCQVCPRDNWCETRDSVEADWIPHLHLVYVSLQVFVGQDAVCFSWNSCNGRTNEKWLSNTFVHIYIHIIYNIIWISYIHIILNPQETEAVMVTCLYSICEMIFLQHQIRSLWALSILYNVENIPGLVMLMEAAFAQ